MSENVERFLERVFTPCFIAICICVTICYSLTQVTGCTEAGIKNTPAKTEVTP